MRTNSKFGIADGLYIMARINAIRNQAARSVRTVVLRRK
jgi:hypothetical protein